MKIYKLTMCQTLPDNRQILYSSDSSPREYKDEYYSTKELAEQREKELNAASKLIGLIESHIVVNIAEITVQESIDNSSGKG